MALGAGPATYGPTVADYYNQGGLVYAQFGAGTSPRAAYASSPAGGQANTSMAPTAWLVGLVAFLVLWRLAYHMGASVGD